MNSSQRMRKTTSSKSDITQMIHLSELSFKLLFLEHTLSSNMIQLMKNANNFMQDKRKLPLPHLRVSNLKLPQRENAELD